MNARSSIVASGLAIAALAASAASSAATRYVFATFLGDDASKEKLSLYGSKNGLDFTLLSHTGYAGPTGVLRESEHHEAQRREVLYRLHAQVLDDDFGELRHRRKHGPHDLDVPRGGPPHE